MVRQKTDQGRDGEGEQDMEEKDEGRETGHLRKFQEKSKRSSEVGSVLEVGESDAEGRKTQEKERAKNMEPKRKTIDDYKPRKRWPAPKNVEPSRRTTGRQGSQPRHFHPSRDHWTFASST